MFPYLANCFCTSTFNPRGTGSCPYQRGRPAHLQAVVVLDATRCPANENGRGWIAQDISLLATFISWHKPQDGLPVFINTLLQKGGFHRCSHPLLFQGFACQRPQFGQPPVGPSINSTAPEQYGLFRLYPSSIIAGVPIEMQVKATSLPSPFISTHSMSELWHLIQIPRGGNKECLTPPCIGHPSTFLSCRNCSN